MIKELSKYINRISKHTSILGDYDHMVENINLVNNFKINNKKI